MDPYNLEGSQIMHYKKSFNEMVLTDDERKRIMSRCDSQGDYDDEDLDEGMTFRCADDSDSNDDEIELNYNELFKKRKQSAMTQEEIMELADVFKKPAEAMCISKLHFWWQVLAAVSEGDPSNEAGANHSELIRFADFETRVKECCALYFCVLL